MTRFWLIIVCISLFGLAPYAWAGSITGMSVKALGTDGKVLSYTITGEGLVDPSVFTLPPTTETSGSRVVVDFGDASIDAPPEAFDVPSNGVVAAVRFSKRENGAVRVVLDLALGAEYVSSGLQGGGFGIAVRGGIAKPATRPVPTKPRYFKNKTPYPILKPANTQPIKEKPVIVIDPGHGGRDPGAVGQRGTLEKKVTLAAAKRLEEKLLNTGRYKVILTRSGDSYVEHEDRLKIARTKSADLFISIHADSTASSSTRGASVYTLADRAKTRSKNIVNSQNWIMDVDLSQQTDPVGDILVDLAQRKTTSQSEMFADELVSALSKSTKLVRNSHRRAGYFVLLAPDVPAVLLELGFLSNRDDEKLLTNTRHQDKILKSVVAAIDSYFDHQNP